MHKILTFNHISIKGLDRFSREHYEVASELGHPDAIMLRSHKLAPADIPDTIKAIARAGAGTNNVPVGWCTEHGIPVFNTPGANANAVKELVLVALLLSSRGILAGIDYVRGLTDQRDAGELSKLLEQEKKRFKGEELVGKKLGVIGLGAIGSSVAEAALMLGMEVLGYDPALSVDAAWRLSRDVQRMENLASLVGKADYISLHLPVLDSTRNLMNADLLAQCKPGTRLLNFAREEIVDTQAIVAALETGKLGCYLADFPHPDLIGRDNVVLMPHIGASTAEAEENCAVMAAQRLRDFLENGNITHSVNFPSLTLERNGDFRLAISNNNVPKILGSILSILADQNINIVDMLNKSRDEIAYNLIDLESNPSQATIDALSAVEGVINVRAIAAGC